MLSENDARRAIGTTAYSVDGDKIGTVGQPFLDDETGRPEFVTVDTGLLGRHETLPTAGRSPRRGEDALRGAPPGRDDVAGGRPGPAPQVRHDRARDPDGPGAQR